MQLIVKKCDIKIQYYSRFIDNIKIVFILLLLLRSPFLE